MAQACQQYAIQQVAAPIDVPQAWLPAEQLFRPHATMLHYTATLAEQLLYADTKRSLNNKGQNAY
jgi:hypothetical protein